MPGGPRAERGMPLSNAMIPGRDSSSLRLLRPRNGRLPSAPRNEFQRGSIDPPRFRSNEVVRGSGPLATTPRGFRSISKPTLSLSLVLFPSPERGKERKDFPSVGRMETVGFASVKRARFVGRHREIEARGIRKRGRHAARRGAARRHGAFTSHA